MTAINPEHPEPSLGNLETSHFGSDSSNYELPTWEDIDVENVEFILDVDLDDLSLFFEDKNIPHFYDELADNYSLLIAEHSNRVIGVVINRFYSRQLRKHPEFISALRYATIIAGNSVLPAPLNTSAKSKSQNGGVKTDLLSDKRDAIAGVARMVDAE